jgi:cytidine deaminase
MTNDQLIEAAAAVLKPYTNKDGRLFGDVGAALISESGKLYRGVCVDTPDWGICAERAAMAAMITDGEYRAKRIAAVWRDKNSGKLFVLAPCGGCREFIRRVDEANLETEFVLGRDRVAKLKDLLPEHHWPQPL